MKTSYLGFVILLVVSTFSSCDHPIIEPNDQSDIDSVRFSLAIDSSINGKLIQAIFTFLPTAITGNQAVQKAFDKSLTATNRPVEAGFSP